MVKLDVSLYLQTIRDALSQCSLFSGLSDEQLDEVARHGELIDYKQNESIAAKGKKGMASLSLCSARLLYRWCLNVVRYPSN